MPHFEETFQKAGPDLAVIAINAGFNDTLADVRAVRDEHKLTMPMVLDDGRLGAAFNLRVTPQHVVIGRDGRIQYVGHFTDERLETALLAARTAATTPAGVASAPRDVREYKPGDSVAKVSATTVDGETFPMRHSSAARPTVLVFLSPWCESYLETSRPAVSASCRTAREQVNRLAKSDRARWLGIASGIWASADDVREYRKQYNVGIPLTLDESGELFRSFRVMNVPTLVIIDAQGRMARRIEGNAENLGTVLEAVL
jgi:peroxiredoxin